MSDSPTSSAPEPVLRVIGAEIRKWRLKRKKSQAVVAHALGITPATVARYEAGQHDIPATKLLALAEVLDIPAASLLGEEALRQPLPPALRSLIRILTQHSELLPAVADLIDAHINMSSSEPL